jgi:hypothetical protein
MVELAHEHQHPPTLGVHAARHAADLDAQLVDRGGAFAARDSEAADDGVALMKGARSFSAPKAASSATEYTVSRLTSLH